MKKTFVRRFTATLGGIFVTASMFSAHAQTGLQVSYGLNGIQTLAYGGTVLENLGANPGDGFHIWHMKSTDLNGNPISSGQYGWGEANNGRSWNPSAHTWTYNFVWGTIQVAFAQVSDALNMTVTTTNYGNSGIIFDGASIYPFVLHFPQLPVNFTNASYNQFADNRTGPSVTVADFGAGEVAAVATDATKPLFSGYQPAGGGNNYTPLMSGTSPDSLAGYLPHYDRPVAPGQTDTYVVALRFAPSGTATAGLAADAYQSWAATYPSTLSWSDRRIIGTVYLASSPSGPANVAGGYPNNPRRYFNDSNAADFDVRTSAGLAKFQAKVLAQAASNVQNLTRLGAQGAITWDIEGEQFPQETSYVCSPDQIATVAPEMESVITNSSSPYAGMKLDDAYFKIMSSAGFRIGVCIRPQQFTLNADGTAGQVYLPDAQVAAQLIRKMKYAHDRWGVTLFYVDSTVQSTGGTLDAGIFQQVAAALPDSLVMPEETTPRHFAYAAPFVSFIFHTALGTDASVYNYYPHAFSVNLVNDVSAATLAQYQTQLTQSVKNGDILMVHADYWQANNPTVVQIYQNAGVTAPTPTPPVPTPPVPTPPVPTPPVPTPPVPAPPVPTPPVPAPPVPTPPVPTPPVPTPPVPTPPVVTGPVAIVSPAAGSTVSGVITVQGTITLPLDAAGSFLMVDGQAIGTRRVTNGPYVYALDTTTLTNGVHSLQIWAHDIGNNTTISPAVQVTVAN